MLAIVHLEPVGGGVPARRVNVGRVAVEQRIRVVVEPNDVGGRTVLDLHAQKSLSDLVQLLDAAKPPRHHAGHARARGLFAVRPPPKRGRLRKAGARLARTDVEATRALQRLRACAALGHGQVKLLARERRELKRAGQLLRTLAQDAKEVDHVPIDVVIGLNG